MAEVRLRVISLGAGVQSTTLCLMAAHGLIGPMPDGALFADTGAEPAAVYDHLRWLQSGNVLPFPVHVVSAGNIAADLMAGTNTGGKRQFAAIPYFLDGAQQGMGRRQCTKEYKVEPLGRKMRAMLGYEPRQRIPAGSVEVWIGISRDEIQRMKPSHVRWQENRWPLIELGMRRWDCLQWLRRNGYPEPPKSACTLCPYRSNEQWRWLRDTDPEGFAEACAVDAAIRSPDHANRSRLRAVPYLHRSLKPLAEVDLSNTAERGQPDLFAAACGGDCFT